MGAGKTTVGKELGRRLHWDFTDLDDLIVQSAGRTVPEIFAEEGEAGFRSREAQALQELLQGCAAGTARVIAVGGGAFVQESNFAAIRQSGIPTIHLDANLPTLLKRCRQERETRPLLQNENQFRQLYEARQSGYMRADHRIDTAGKAVGEIVNEIILCLGLGDEYSEVSPAR